MESGMVPSNINKLELGSNQFGVVFAQRELKWSFAKFVVKKE